MIVSLSGGLGSQIAMYPVVEEYAKNVDVKLITTYAPFFRTQNTKIEHIHPLTLKEPLPINIVLSTFKYPTLDQENISLSEMAAKLLNVEERYYKPKIIVSEKVKQWVNSFFKVDKPSVIFQPFGKFYNKKKDVDYTGRSLGIDYAQELVCKMIEEGYKVFQLYKPDEQPLLKFVNEINCSDYYKLSGMINEFKYFVCIDSCLQHIATALGKKAFVMWINTNENVFGHPSNVNFREVEGYTFYGDHKIRGTNDLSFISNKGKTLGEKTMQALENYLKE